MSMAPPPATTDAFFIARRTIMMASCSDRSACVATQTQTQTLTLRQCDVRLENKTGRNGVWRVVPWVKLRVKRGTAELAFLRRRSGVVAVSRDGRATSQTVESQALVRRTSMHCITVFVKHAPQENT